jgi:hypothetical protein
MHPTRDMTRTDEPFRAPARSSEVNVTMPFDQIRASIPNRCSQGVRLERSPMEVQCVPSGQKRPRHGHGHGIGWEVDAERFARHQEGIDGSNIVIPDLGEMTVGEGRKEMIAGSVDAFVHRVCGYSNARAPDSVRDCEDRCSTP